MDFDENRPYNQGARVEYRDSAQEKKNGVVKSVQGSGQQARYTIQGDDGQTDTVPFVMINRSLD